MVSAQTVGPAQQLAAVSGRMPSSQRVPSARCELALLWALHGHSPTRSVLTAAPGGERASSPSYR